MSGISFENPSRAMPIKAPMVSQVAEYAKLLPKARPKRSAVAREYTKPTYGTNAKKNQCLGSPTDAIKAMKL